jgi:hypothetical protein
MLMGNEIKSGSPLVERVLPKFKGRLELIRKKLSLMKLIGGNLVLNE